MAFLDRLRGTTPQMFSPCVRFPGGAILGDPFFDPLPCDPCQRWLAEGRTKKHAMSRSRRKPEPRLAFHLVLPAPFFPGILLSTLSRKPPQNSGKRIRMAGRHAKTTIKPSPRPSHSRIWLCTRRTPWRRGIRCWGSLANISWAVLNPFRWLAVKKKRRNGTHTPTPRNVGLV